MLWQILLVWNLYPVYFAVKVFCFEEQSEIARFVLLSVRPFLLAACSIKFVLETYTERGGYFAKVCRKEET